VSDSLSPNIGLLIADPNDVVTYTTHIGNNFTRTDTFLGMVDCLSTSRPTTTFKGQGIYEEDSKRYAQNLGTSASPNWVYMSHQAMTGTAASRPTSGLTAGELMYETDTHITRSRGAAAWNPVLATFSSGSLPASATSLQGDFAYASDKQATAAFNGTSWFYTSPVICTSSTHPSSNVQDGTQIFETDTNLFANSNGAGGWLYPVQQAALTQVLGSTTASVTFSGLPAVSRIMLAWRVRSSASGGVFVQMQIDGNTGSVYLWNKNSASAGTASNAHSGALVTAINIGVSDGNTASYFGNGYTVIDGWGSATGFASCCGSFTNFATTTADDIGNAGGLYTGAVGPHTSVKMFLSANSFVSGSQFSVYVIP